MVNWVDSYMNNKIIKLKTACHCACNPQNQKTTTIIPLLTDLILHFMTPYVATAPIILPWVSLIVQRNMEAIYINYTGRRIDSSVRGADLDAINSKPAETGLWKLFCQKANSEIEHDTVLMIHYEIIQKKSIAS